VLLAVIDEVPGAANAAIAEAWKLAAATTRSTAPVDITGFAG
jgi:hypothetical protein